MKRLYLFTTRECNQRCIFCVRHEKDRPTSPEISSMDLKNAISELSGSPGSTLIFDGGEPLLRKDFLNLLRYSVEMNVENISVLTNGTLLADEKMVSEISEVSKDVEFSVSLHSHIPELSDGITKCRGGFQQTAKGISNLLRHGFRVSIYHVITSRNYTNITDFVRFLNNRFPEVKTVTLSFLYPSGMVLENPSIIPKFSDVRPHLMEALDFLKRNSYRCLFATCGIVPLCFIEGQESMILGQMKKDQKEAALFDSGGHSRYRLGSKEWHRLTKVKSDKCEECDYESLCPGIWSIYAELYGLGELKPVRFDPGRHKLARLTRDNFAEMAEEMKKSDEIYFIEFPGDDYEWQKRAVKELEKNGISFVEKKGGIGDGKFMNFIPVTQDCNNNCISCPVPRRFKKENMKFEEIIEEIDKMSENSDYIELNGGEPTLRGDLLRIMGHIETKGKQIFLLTNCERCYYEDYAKKLAAIKNLKVITTIYGHNGRLHDAISRTPGSFARKMKGLKNLLKHGIDTELRVLLHKMNYQDFGKMADFIINNFNSRDLEKVAVMNPKLTSNAGKNRKVVMERISDISGVLEGPVNRLAKKGFRVELYHFPHCVLPESLWQYSKGITAADISVFFPVSCNTCNKKGECSGIWRSYYNFNGPGEFVPIT